MNNPNKDAIKPKFSGHDSFALRYGWLYKIAQEAAKKNPPFISPEEDMITYGVGKNMVVAMKYWAKSFGILESDQLTDFGNKIFSDDGWDKYLEDEGTLWVLHWKLASSKDFNTMWWWQLGGCIEKSLGRITLVNLFLVSAIASNLGQFMVSGPYFGGLSGVVYALVGFIWWLGWLAPEKGLSLSKPIIGFLLFWLVLGFVDLLPVNTANTAHLLGLISGCLMALLTVKADKKLKL